MGSELCIACQLGLPTECYTRPGKGCKVKKQPEIIRPATAERVTLDDIGGPSDTKRRALKPADTIKDAHSTGRKRAAELYPLPKDGEPPLICEWAGLRNACGGEFPIIGCFPPRIAKNRHHGPDKNTLNNDPGNVHRICAHCHNRWHALNDPGYEKYREANTDADGIFTPRPHDSETRATPEELVANEKKWGTLPNEYSA